MGEIGSRLKQMNLSDRRIRIFNQLNDPVWNDGHPPTLHCHIPR
jgi:hypothetical protein